jgi:hypothetical protein
MAKIIFSGVAGVDMRNKLNGSVFSKNRYGSYVRTKVTPVNPQTTAQQAARNRLSTNSQAWRGLTEDQRQSWIDAAVNFPFTDIYGNTKILSGQALYVKLNNNLNQIGLPSLTDAPAPVALPAIETLSAAVSVGGDTNTLTFTPTPLPADVYMVVQATGNVTPGKNFVKNLYRFITYFIPTDVSPQNIDSVYKTIHGNPVEDQKIFYRVFMVSGITGQAGIPVQTSTIVAA